MNNKKIINSIEILGMLLILASACRPLGPEEAYPAPIQTATAIIPHLSPAVSVTPRLPQPDFLPNEKLFTATPRPTFTPIPNSWLMYNLPGSGIRLRYPENWQAENSYRYSGKNGFFEVGFQPYKTTIFGNLRTLCILEANLHKAEQYGEHPILFDWQGWSSETKSWFGHGCGVIPSPEMGLWGSGVLFANYTSDPQAGQILILRADAEHFTGILDTLRLDAYVTATPSSGSYTSPLCVLTAVPQVPVVTQVAGLTITEYPIADAACHPYNHFDSFQSMLPTQAQHADKEWYQQDQEYRALNLNQVQVGDKTVRWELDNTRTSNAGAPQELYVLQNEQVIFTLELLTMQPGGGPVRDLWAWDGHWVLEAENVLVIDGEIQNPLLKYDEIFNWHIVAKRPFYFFRQKDTFGMAYDGQTLPLHYDQIIHGFLCCDPARYSIWTAPIGARFYAQRDGVWWFVEVKADG